VGAYGSDSGHRPALPEIAARRAEPFFGRLPRGAEVVIIGDTPADIHCGEAIAARAVGVATGSYSVADLAACGPHAVFEDLSDTDRVLEAILR
jgi:phosphoglycolate phosphatase-like HAD superfamily hydrolase